MKRNWKCQNCGKYQNRLNRVHKKFCSEHCHKTKLKTQTCKGCGQLYEAQILSQRYCKNCDNNYRARSTYETRLKQNLCKNCGEPFLGTKHKLLCSKCKNNLPNPLIHTYDNIERPVVCPNCGDVIKYESVKLSGRTASHKINKYQCSKCKRAKKPVKIKRARTCIDCGINISEPFHKCDACKERTQQLKKQKRNGDPITTHKNISRRMRVNNPMFNAETRKKVASTFKRKILTGELTFKRGSEHHLWKGHRGFNLTCRSRLYPIWIRPILTRDNFTCTMCGKKGGILHVHHIRPLKDIIAHILHKNNIDKITEISQDSALYNSLIEQVLAEHALQDGITVCPKCHSKIDSKYRRKKHENKKNQ